MSHQPERKEKNCLNCGTLVAGRFCQHCGQENIETRESFWSLTRHFVFDVLHFDGQFFQTTRYLFTRPGFVARQYAEGRRVSYLHPIRMYLFMSAVFFLLFFSLENSGRKRAGAKPSGPVQRVRLAQSLNKRAARHPDDTALRARIARLLDTANPVYPHDLDPDASTLVVFNDKVEAHTVAQYDSVQSALQPAKRDGWLKRKLTRRALEIDSKYEGSTDKAGEALVEQFTHSVPYIFFFSLPFFALLLKLLYARRKNFYYSDHAVFTLYHYILSFQLMLVALLLSGVSNWTGWNWPGYLAAAVMLAGLVYLYLEMKRFYRQSSGKTLVKFLLLQVLGAVVVFILFVGFLFFSIYQL